jgi:hypothetical protein
MHDTKLALRRWNSRPFEVLGPWLALSLMISLGLLCAVYAVAELTTPDSTRYVIPGYTEAAGLDDYVQVLFRNSLVLALHAMACVAGFIAGSSLPHSAASRTGLSRWVHEKAGPLAIAFVVGATTFSLVTQAYVLGGGAATLSWQLAVDPAGLLAVVAVHALPELVALFLPLAAWMVASRQGDWHELLAATFVTVAIAVPVLLVSAVVEVYLTPELLVMLAT